MIATLTDIHVQFVRDHQRKIRRMAFIAAEIATFTSDQLPAAVAWAAAG